MSDSVSLPALFDAAERAALGGDYAGAARWLADAARAQEAALGADHLDLANTLNNLAVAHERSGQLDDAEREYRRAHAIAARVLPPDDPLVTTSRQNLREFCEANGRPIEPRPAPLPLTLTADAGAAPAVTLPRREADVPTSPIEPLPISLAPDAGTTKPAIVAPVTAPAPLPARPRPVPAAPPRAARRPSIPMLVALGAVALLVIWLFTRRGPAAPEAEPQAAAPDGTPAAAPAATPAPTRAPGATTPARSRAAAPPATGSDGLTVSDVQLCVALSADYRCERARSPVPAGRLTFYTKLVSPRDTSVVHRWYRNGKLRQAVRLDVPPRRQGYRTFSRGTVHAGDGDWRVELRTRDGELLHTETFTVR